MEVRMKRQRHLILVVMALIAALAFLTGPVAAKATKTEFTGTDTRGAVTDPGILTFPDGNVHLRGMVLELHIQATDPRVTGPETVVANANLDAYGAGPVWGTSHLEVDYGGGGIWEGTWNGKIHADGSESIRFVAHGIAGSVEGLKMSGSLEFPADPTAPGILAGRILAPHGD
jgi:hypothetical protein